MSVEHTEDNVAAKGMPRRVIVKSAAWSVPVFAAVGVTPAFAASGGQILSSTNLRATRPAASPGKTVNFTWTVAWAPDAGVPTTGSVVYSQPARFTVTGPSTISGNTLKFTGRNQESNEFTVLGFTITVTFTYKSQSRVATFNVTGFTVGSKGMTSDATFDPVTVSPEANNPKVTA